MKKTSIAKIAGGLALLALSSMATASVVNTKHNLGATSNNQSALGNGGPGSDGPSNHTTATTEICIFCHTPHGGDQTTTAPIWNRATGTATYLRYSSLGRLTFDAKEAPVGSVSAACLSCHDGTQAMDAVINSSGSDSIGTEDTGTGVKGNFSQGRAMGNGTFKGVTTGFTGAGGTWNGVISSGGGVGRDMVFLGTDLSNDHPISMQYGGGGIDSTHTTSNTTDPDFAQQIGASIVGGGVASAGNRGGLINADGTVGFAGFPSNAAPGNTTSDNIGGVKAGVAGSGSGAVVYQPTNGKPRWFVDTSGSAAAYSSTDFPLYTRASTDADGGVVGSGAAQPTVECGTCHDPHSGNPTFLRLPNGNAGSQVCLTCHAK